MRIFLPIFFAALLYCLCSYAVTAAPDGESKYAVFSPDGIPFVVADTAWDVDRVGNHRTVVEVSAQTEAVRSYQ